MTSLGIPRGGWVASTRLIGLQCGPDVARRRVVGPSAWPDGYHCGFEPQNLRSLGDWSLVLDCDERLSDGGGARAHSQPGVDLVEMCPDCSLRDTETSCDLVVGVALCHELK